MKYEKELKQIECTHFNSDLLSICGQITDNADHVKIDDTALAAFANSIKKPAFIPNWHEYLAPNVTDPKDDSFIANPETRLAHAAFQLSMNCVINGGYLYKGSEGQTLKWEKEGSGAAALKDCLDKMREEKIVPHYDIEDPEEAAESLKDIFAGVPEGAYRDERSLILSDFADHYKWYRARTLIQNSIDHKTDTIKITLPRLIDYGAWTSESGFMEDPFVKKLSLVSILLASYAHGQGVQIDLDVPVPADYRIPQTLHNIGVLRLSDDLVTRINNDELFHEDAQAVTELRAACIVAAEKIKNIAQAKLADEDFNYQMNHLDGDLWFLGRIFETATDKLDDKKRAVRGSFEEIARDSDFVEAGFMRTTAKHINVDTLRF